MFKSLGAALLAGLVLALLGLPIPQAQACTTFLAPTGQGPLVAKGFDWMTGEGWMVANERSRHRRMLFAEGSSSATQWKSRYSSLTLSTLGPGFPVSGMNEMGLVIEALVDLSQAAAQLPQPNQLTSLELVQYGLDECATAQCFADTSAQMGFSQIGIGLHLFACDRAGTCAVVETKGNRVQVTSGTQLGAKVLANRPYQEDYSAPGPSFWARLWGGTNSDQRFQIASRAVSGATPMTVADSFELLDRVRIAGMTKWQLVWEPSQNQLHYRLPGRVDLVQVLKVMADLPCDGAPKVYPLGLMVGVFAPWRNSDLPLVRRAVVGQLGGRVSARLVERIVASTNSSQCVAP